MLVRAPHLRQPIARRLARLTSIVLMSALSITMLGAVAAPAQAVDASSITGSTPKISDTTPKVGQTISVKTGSWQPTEVSLGYQWYRGSSAIPGATGPTYQVVAEDLGNRLKVAVTGTGTGTQPQTVSKTSSSTSKVAKGSFGTKPKPSITPSSPVVQQTLTVNTGSWAPAPDNLSYQWYRISTKNKTSKISGATSASYTPKLSDKSYRFKVVVKASRAGYYSSSRTSSKTAKTVQLTFSQAVRPTITGEVKPNGTLNAELGSWTPTPDAISYQWRRNGTAISGADQASYTITDADLGRALTVAVTATKAGYATSTLVSTSVTPVGPSSDLRVGTFNLYGQNNDGSVSADRKWAKRQPVAAAQILDEALDVVGLQEASPTTDQAGQLVAELNKQGGSYRKVDTADFSNGTKIIYNSDTLSMTDSGVYKYNAQADASNKYRQRFLTWATFRSESSGKSFFFASTHLDPYSSKNSVNTNKVRQWRELIAAVPRLNSGNLPVVVVGDFNTSKWWSETQETLPAMKAAGFGDVMNQQYQVNPPSGVRAEKVVNGWINSYNGFRADVSQYSYPTRHDKVGNGIDWIFATNSLRVKQWKVVIDFNPNTLTVNGIMPSDHNMITSILVL